MYEGIPSGLKPPSAGYGGAENDQVLCIIQIPSKVIYSASCRIGTFIYW